MNAEIFNAETDWSIGVVENFNADGYRKVSRNSDGRCRADDVLSDADIDDLGIDENVMIYAFVY